MTARDVMYCSASGADAWQHGTSTTSKVAYGFTSGVFPVIITVTAGIRMADDRLLAAAKSMGATRRQ